MIRRRSLQPLRATLIGLRWINAGARPRVVLLLRREGKTMTTPGNETTVTGPFDWLFATVGEWGRLLAVARELRRIDGECLDVMLEAAPAAPTRSRRRTPRRCAATCRC